MKANINRKDVNVFIIVVGPYLFFFLLFFVAKPNPCYAFIHIHSVHIHSDGQGFRPENPPRGIYNLNTLCF